MLIYIMKQGKSYQADNIFKYEGSYINNQEQVRIGQNYLHYLNMMPENVIPEWIQPTGGHDSYNAGDKVIYEGNESLRGNIGPTQEVPQGVGRGLQRLRK